MLSLAYEGLEGLHVVISGGDICLIAGDDGINAAGGNDASGTDGGRDGMFGDHGGFDSSFSDGTILISGGNLYIHASGDGIDANGTLEISGGIFIGTGASGMAQTFSDSTQGVIAVNAGQRAAGTLIILTDQKGNTVMSYTSELDFNVVILSSPDIISGDTYTSRSVLIQVNLKHHKLISDGFPYFFIKISFSGVKLKA